MVADVGDLVEVRRERHLNPALRFYYGKKGIVTKVLELDRRYVILFENGKTMVLRGYEINILAKLEKDGKQ
jgi:hypothetical protein